MKNALLLVLFALTPLLGQTPGCTDISALNYNPEATIDDGSCVYLDPPANLQTTPSPDSITLNWNPATEWQPGRNQVIIWISDVTDSYVEISMTNSESVNWIQFIIDADEQLEAVFGNALPGGLANQNGFMISTNPQGLVLAGSPGMGSVIPPTSGVLMQVSWTFTDTDGFLTISDLLAFELGGHNLLCELGPPYCNGFCADLVVSYNIYRDDEQILNYHSETSWIDANLALGETHCYQVSASLLGFETDLSETACATTGAVLGCMDPEAMNFDPLVTEDNGSCIYSDYSGPVWYVTADGADSMTDGSAFYPFATVQHAILISQDGDTVRVGQGYYPENIDFLGKAIAVISEYFFNPDDDIIHNTVLDGHLNGSTVTISNAAGVNILLCGFTITGGSGTWLPGQGKYSGGGIFVEYADPVLSNLMICNNIVNQANNCKGGGITLLNSSAQLSNISVIGNQVNGYGGGLFIQYSTPNIEYSRIHSNSAGQDGGGITASYCDGLVLNHVEITENISGETAGGMWLAHSHDLVFNHLTIADNSTELAGGAMHCWNTQATIVNSIIWNNLPTEIHYHVIGDPNHFTVTYSDLHGGQSGILLNDNGMVDWLAGNLNSDPLFVHPGMGDYQLQEISPCIDTGNPDYPLDPDGTIADMGALYFHQNCPEVLPGDMNLDESVDVLDVVYLVYCILDQFCQWDIEDCEFWAADLDGDGYLYVPDIVMMVAVILGE